jgi:hypothetical protein
MKHAARRLSALPFAAVVTGAAEGAVTGAILKAPTQGRKTVICKDQI